MFKLPDWLKRDKVKLPPWARLARNQNDKCAVVIEIDTAAAIQDWLRLLNVGEPDQYWLEVAYQCAKLDVMAATAGTEYDPAVAGKAATFLFSRAPQYAQANFRRGRGAELASKGREARQHYIRIRGSLPN